MTPTKQRRNHLTPEKKLCMYTEILENHMLGQVGPGFWTRMARQYGVCQDIPFKIWKTATTQRAQGKKVTIETFAPKKRRGAPLKWDREAIKEETKKIPFKKRRTVKALAYSLGVPYSTMVRICREGVVHRHRSFLKPTLNDEHKIARIQYALSMRDPNDPTKYQDMYDRVHVDEKWFYMTKDGECYILADGKEPPERHTRHKNHIVKVQFLCAMARPRVVNGELWDGKIGIWPVGEVELAKRGSKNRPKGTPEWKNANIDRDKYRELMVNEVLPAILHKFPAAYLDRRGRGVKIQQDGAKSHILETDEEWLEAVRQTRCNITLYTQPAQSPDTNLNDLAFFASIQNLYYESAPNDAMQLIKAVQDAYLAYDPKKINRMWITHQMCMNETLKHHGGNNYKLPHMNKEKLEREGRLPVAIKVDASAEWYDRGELPP